LAVTSNRRTPVFFRSVIRLLVTANEYEWINFLVGECIVKFMKWNTKKNVFKTVWTETHKNISEFMKWISQNYF
jgi:hypothetical protein